MFYHLFITNNKRMNRSKRVAIHKVEKKGSISSRLRMPMSEYSLMYKKYMLEQFPAAQLMIKKIIQMPACHDAYLQFPLEGLLRGAVKKMMLNSYELSILGFFLEQTDSWSINNDIIQNLFQVFPDIIHVNEPSCSQKLKELSIFLYLSCYSVKQFLNPNIEMFRKEMSKVFPQFQHLHIHWINNQSTVNMALNPRGLNEYCKRLQKMQSFLDYNTCVDKIIQISPCYDLSAKVEKKKIPEFGYMETNNRQLNAYNPMSLVGQQFLKQEPDNMDLMGEEFQFDGGDI